MTKTEKRIAIATATGWVDVKEREVEFPCDGYMVEEQITGKPSAEDRYYFEVPYYDEDYDAWHRIEEKMSETEIFEYEQLCYALYDGYLICTPASIREEAFLKMKGLWKA